MYMKKQKQPVEAFVMVGIMILSKLRSAKNEDRIENMKEKKTVNVLDFDVVIPTLRPTVHVQASRRDYRLQQ